MPLPGEPRNPDGVRMFVRFHPAPVKVAARRQDTRVRWTRQEPGTIRRLWRNLAGYVAPAAPFSWTRNGRDTSPAPAAVPITTPLRYLVTTRNVLTVGNQLSRPMKRPALPPRVAHTAPSLVMAGNVGYRPTVRSRVPSFGSRVPALNNLTIPGVPEAVAQ